MYQAFNHKHDALLIFLDLTKAFDTVDHSIFVFKLNYYGFRGNIHRWFSSYMKGRMQNCRGLILVLSNSIAIAYSRGCYTSRVQPRATLFKIYVNDMTYAPKKVKFILFADDTILNINTKSHSHIVEISNRELPKVVRWISSNKFILNSY